MNDNPIGWCEVPVIDMDRAIEFYNAIFGWELEKTPMGPVTMAWFPSKQNGTGSSGSLVHHKESYRPSATEGALIYFTSPDVAETLKKVKTAGGKVLREKTLITEDIGYMGLFLDSEGNRIALHSRQ